MTQSITRKEHRDALEHEKSFWKGSVPHDSFSAIQSSWKNSAAHFQSITQQYMNLDANSHILQIGQAVQDAINFWEIGRRFAVDPLSNFYKKEFGLFDQNIQYVTGVGEYLPLANSSVDVILCLNVLDHVMDPALVIAECKRVLRKKGIFFLGVEVFPESSLSEGRNDPIHFWKFTAEEVKHMLAKHSFILEQDTLCDDATTQGANWYWLVAVHKNK